MIPVVTPEEMGAIDAAAPEPVEVLVERAGAATFRAALDLLGGTYGRRVVLVAGKGNNGADGRSAARRLRRRGVRVEEIDAARLPAVLPDADLVIDAAYGTGFRGEWTPPPAPDGAAVLAVDIPSGVDGLTGVAHGSPWPADLTVTFAALKPGLLLRDGPAVAGEVRLADIGLDTSRASIHVVEPVDVAAWIPSRAHDAHKWQAACWIVAGSPGMTGAAHLSAAGAQRAGAGYVRLSTPGVERDAAAPTETVGVPLPPAGWADEVLAAVDRVRALGVGPGLGRGDAAGASVRALVAASARPPIVVDGDGLAALADDVDGALTAPLADPVRRRFAVDSLSDEAGEGCLTRGGAGDEGDERAAEGDERAGEADGRAALGRDDAVPGGTLAGPTDVVGNPAGPPVLAPAPTVVLTPHDGELARLGADPDAADRVAEVRALAARRGAVVLSKGPTTVVAAPDGRVLLATSGDARLATAGTGDVLTGAITALLAQGLAPLEAAAAGAHLHGRAGALACRRGLVAGDVAAHLPAALDELPEI